MRRPGFWDDQAKAAATGSEHARLSRRLERYDALAGEASDLTELAQLASSDEELDEVAHGIDALKHQLRRVEEDALFAGKYDLGDAVVTI